MSMRVLAAVAVMAAASPWTAVAQAPAVSVVLKPLAANGEISQVEVRQSVSGFAAAAGQTLFTVPARVTTILGQPYAEADIVARDEAGPLPLAMAVAPAEPGYPLEMRTFSPRRATQGAITLSYAADVTPAMSPRRPGPSYDLRGADGGFGGAFFSFLLLPADVPADFKLDWDLSAAPAGARGVSTLGEGAVSLSGPTGGINTIFLLGGAVQGYAPPGERFSAYWIGRPPFDPQTASAWSARSYRVLQDLFVDPAAPPYVLLMRPFARPRDGGGATNGGFMLEYGLGQMSDVSRRIMFTHEMVHHFVGSLSGDTGANAWFGEGLAEFYKIRAPLRAGLISLDEAAAEIAVMTGAYYNSSVVDAPFAELGRRRWADGAAQSAPYNRGFMYFVDLDAAVRARSGGARSLDDLVLAMLASRRAGGAYDEAKWRDLLRAELGEAGPARLDAMLAGDLIVPPADAFGPCLARRKLEHPRPVLGMSEDAFLMKPAVISGLQPGSAAAQAGLRDGDELVSFQGVAPRIAHSASNVRLDPVVQLVVRRDGVERQAAFSTQGPVVAEYVWSPVAAAGRSCAL
ncbi:hypothetical protein [Phenylobacterium sp.]|uniref:hypothetical protein n=1 Tax=Phenylobacterium sp. TaxID=1871053 RepID=UPI0025D071CB|nr:hypothetical protein [Phenylobacterium sp.]